MRSVRDQSGARPPRKLDVTRIKLVIVSIGAGISALISSFTGITPQASFAPMLGWMLGFSAGKSQATAMRATAGATIACAAGALWQSSVNVVIAPNTATRLSQIKVAHVVPSAFAITVAMLFVGATLGAIVSSKAVPRADMVALRRAFLFVGVCIGIYVAAEGTHFNTFSTSKAPIVAGAAAFLALGVVSGALTQILGLASGIVLVPSLFYFAGLTIQQSILVSVTVIALASLLPAWSYNKRGLGDMQFGAAGMIGGMTFGFAGGAFLLGAPSRLLLLLFAAMAMFFSAREISIIAMAPTTLPSSSSDAS